MTTMFSKHQQNRCLAVQHRCISVSKAHRGILTNFILVGGVGVSVVILKHGQIFENHCCSDQLSDGRWWMCPVGIGVCQKSQPF
nr:uncharacterized protein LOC108020270 isoform X2 [Drosophila suzukii]